MGWFSRKKATRQDPVCGMDVEEGKEAGKATHGGETYLFCSSGCERKFKESPGKFVKAKPAKAT
jgi:YHS domain-containing protein